jgi:hypothetical protein
MGGTTAFTIIGELYVKTCSWNLNVDTNYIHFNLGGLFKCDNMNVTLGYISNLKFMKSIENSSPVVECSSLRFENGLTTSGNYHFNIASGNPSFKGCVWIFVRFSFYFFFRVLKTFQESFFISAAVTLVLFHLRLLIALQRIVVVYYL